MEGLLRRMADIVPFEEKADFYAINTCSVTSLMIAIPPDHPAAQRIK